MDVSREAGDEEASGAGGDDARPAASGRGADGVTSGRSARTPSRETRAGRNHVTLTSSC